MIVTKNSKKMQTALMKRVGQGMTIYQGVKGYSSKGEQTNSEIIHTVINRIDSKKAYRTVDDADEDAFVIEFDANSMKGGVLRKYLTHESSEHYQRITTAN